MQNGLKLKLWAWDLSIYLHVWQSKRYTVLCKSHANENCQISLIVLSKSHWTFVWKFVGRFSPALRVISPEQRAMFLRIFVTERKFAIKSLGKRKQFSSRHAWSSCHVMSPKQEIKISLHGRFYTLVWTALVVFYLRVRIHFIFHYS